MSDFNSCLVYFIEIGCIDEVKLVLVCLKGDGIVWIQCQISGCKGKGVCLISGIDVDDVVLIVLVVELKKKCGCGGVVKDGVIEIQGDKWDLFKLLFEVKGMKVKLVGG